MSALSPVGPLPPRVYWMRRAFVLGLPLILIVVLAASCLGGGSKKPAASGGGSSPGPSTTTTSGGVCAATDLTVSVTSSATTYVAGESPEFIGTFTNTSTAPCTLTTSPSNEAWSVSSGAAQWWATAGCPRSKVSSTKTLAAGATRKVTIQWDGHRLEPGCSKGDPAQPGTYHLDATLDGVTAQQVTFHFTKNTQ